MYFTMTVAIVFNETSHRDHLMFKVSKTDLLSTLYFIPYYTVAHFAKILSICEISPN
jgi:hypothetical protein